MYDGLLALNGLDINILKTASSSLSSLTSALKSFSSLKSSITATVEILNNLSTTLVKLNLLQTASAAASTANTAATQVNNTAKTLNIAVTKMQADEVNRETQAEIAQNTTMGLGAALMGVLTGTVTLHTLATTAATAATNLFKMALNALPLVAIATAITAIITAIVALVKHLSAGSAAFQAQKKEVEALASAQEELAQSAQESADAFDDSFVRIQASGTVAKELVDQMKDVSTSTADAADKHQQMAALCTQLNSAMDGLNLAYNKETGAITIPPPRGHRSDCLNLKQAPEIQDFRGLLQCFGRISIQLSAWRTAERDEPL